MRVATRRHIETAKRAALWRRSGNGGSLVRTLHGRCAQSHRAPRAEPVVSPHMSFAPKLRPEVAVQWPDLAHIDGVHGALCRLVLG